jgi:hypothetical protein
MLNGSLLSSFLGLRIYFLELISAKKIPKETLQKIIYRIRIRTFSMVGSISGQKSSGSTARFLVRWCITLMESEPEPYRDAVPAQAPNQMFNVDRYKKNPTYNFFLFF